GCGPDRLEPMLVDGFRDALLDDVERTDLLGREMMVEGARRHAGRSNNVVRAGRVIATLLKGVRCRIQDAFSHSGGIVGSQAAARWLPGHERLPPHSASQAVYRIDKTGQPVCFA